MLRGSYKIGFSAVLILVLGIFAGVAAQTVSGSIANGIITRGGRARATVVLSMPGGVHVNSNRPDSEYAIATTVKASGRGVRVGPVSYPRGRNRKFQFSENSINVYDGTVRFGFDVTVPAGYTGKSIAVKVTVRYQACTDEVCYPPKNKTLNLTANVR